MSARPRRPDPGQEPAPERPPWNTPGLADRPEFLERIAWVAAHRKNTEGTDKTWVERSVWTFRAAYRDAVRVR